MTARPVSSSTSRTTACSSVSPGSIRPPGSDQSPAPGSLRRLISSSRSASSLMIAPTHGTALPSHSTSRLPQRPASRYPRCGENLGAAGEHEGRPRPARAATPACAVRPSGPAPGTASSTARCTRCGPRSARPGPGSTGCCAGPWCRCGCRGRCRRAGWSPASPGAGDERTGTQGCAVALSGPSPVGGPGEMMLVSEDPGSAWGRGSPGLDGPDPGAQFTGRPARPLRAVRRPRVPAVARRGARPGGVRRGGHGHLAVAGAVAATPPGVLLVEPLPVRDLRDPGQELDLPFGAPSPQLPG